jgi:hypothetical protein
MLSIDNKNNIVGNKTLSVYASDSKVSKKKNVVLVLLNWSYVTEDVNESMENVTNKTIDIRLEYKTGSIYDIDDNGIETKTGVIDFTVEDTRFNFAVDESKLCTRWSTYSLESGEETTVCYGSSDCCSLVNLMPVREKWNEVFYSYYGLYGATLDNIISAQVIYADYNLSVEEPYAKVYYSKWDNLSVKFYKEVIPMIQFEDVCVETCLLYGFDKGSYKLIFEINNTILYLDSIKYTIAVNATENNAPALIKNISDITINNNENYSINLDEYFYDEDKDKLIYSYYKADNITVLIEDNIATIIPDNEFTGNRYMFFRANDSLLTAVSNVFKITVKEGKIEEVKQLKAEIGKPVRWVKRAKNKTIAIPDYAYNLSIRKIINNEKIQLEKNKIRVKYKGKLKSLDEFEIDKKLEKLYKELEKVKGKEGIQKKINELLTLKESFVSEEIAENETAVVIEESADSFEVSYETDAPEAYEEEINNYNKKIIISSEISYTNVRAYTDITESSKNSIRLYWYIDGVKVDVTNNKEINLTFIDSNANNLIDRLEWIVPHLSNQTFEVSITILNVQSYPTVGAIGL